LSATTGFDAFATDEVSQHQFGWKLFLRIDRNIDVARPRGITDRTRSKQKDARSMAG